MPMTYSLTQVLVAELPVGHDVTLLYCHFRKVPTVFLGLVVFCLNLGMYVCRGAQGKGLVAPLVHLLVSGGPSDQARAARALSNMATDSSVKEQIVAAGMASPTHCVLHEPSAFAHFAARSHMIPAHLTSLCTMLCISLFCLNCILLERHS